MACDEAEKCAGCFFFLICFSENLSCRFLIKKQSMTDVKSKTKRGETVVDFRGLRSVSSHFETLSAAWSATASGDSDVSTLKSDFVSV